MNVDTMRRIDRQVGVPLCAVATLLVRAWEWLRGRDARPLRRILFVELSEMGTTVLAQPAMRRAREKLGAELYFVIFARNVGSLDLTGEFPAANVFTIRDTSLYHLARDTLAFLAWTRRNAIDTVIDLELFSRFTALITGFSGADRRVGFHRFHQEGLYRGEMLTHRVAYNSHIHMAKNLIALVEALALPVQVPYTKMRIDDDLRVAIPPASDQARGKMLACIRAESAFDPARQRLVLINPNASEMLPHRRWMAERYAELIRRVIAGHADVLIAVTGAPSERAEAEALAKEAGPRCISLAGKTELAELPALYAHAAVMVSNDSGPAHFAAAAGLSTIVLFGPETPRLYQPLGPSRAIYAGLACSPCVSAHNHRKTACTDNVCMKAIGVDEVYAAVCESLAGADAISAATRTPR
jgi:ADP-heptose:LPS heptosyltransferase